MNPRETANAAKTCGHPSGSNADFEGWVCVLEEGHDGNHVIGRPSDTELAARFAAERRARVSVVISTGHRLDFKVTDAEAAKVTKYTTKLVKPDA